MDQVMNQEMKHFGDNFKLVKLKTHMTIDCKIVFKLFSWCC